MKKFISYLLTIIMCLSLCACDGEKEVPTKPSKEEVIAQAEDLRIDDLLYEIENNMARAEEQYNDKIVKIKNFKAETISSYDDYATVEMTYWGGPNSVLIIKAKLSKEDAMQINKGDKITIVGVVDIQASTFVDLNDAFLVTE